MKKIMFLVLLFTSCLSFADGVSLYTDYSVTNISTNPVLIGILREDISSVSIFDSSGKVVILSVQQKGTTAVSNYYIPPGGGDILVSASAGASIFLSLTTGTNASGYNIINKK